MKLARKDVKRINRGTVFQFIRNAEEPLVSSIVISRATKLSLPTVRRIIDYFVGRGLLRTAGAGNATGAGRKSTLLEFIPDAFSSIGVAFDAYDVPAQ